jgi:hypothetical protein
MLSTIANLSDLRCERSEFRSSDYVASVNGTEQHYPALVEVLAPQGQLGLIDDPKSRWMRTR